MIVGEPGEILLEITGRDWRPDAVEFVDDGRIEAISDGRRSLTIAIFGVEGRIEFTLEVDQDRLRLVNPFGDGPPSATDSVLYSQNGRDVIRWHVEALAEGKAPFIIRSSRASEADVTIEVEDEELAKLRADDLNLELSLEIDALRRNTWLGFTWWHGWFLLLPFVGPGSFSWVGRRRPSGPPVGDKTNGDAAASSGSAPGSLGLALSGGGLRAAAYSLGAMMYLADAHRGADVGQVASVSGGSLTNAFVANRAAELGRAPESAAELATLASAVAERGLPLERAAKLFACGTLVGAGWIVGLSLWAAPRPTTALLPAIAVVLLFAVVSWLVFVHLGVRLALRRWVRNFTVLPKGQLLAELGGGSGLRQTNLFTATTSSSQRVHMAQSQSAIAAAAPDKETLGHAVGATQQQVSSSRSNALHTAKAVQASAAFPGLPRVRVRPRESGFVGLGVLALRDGGTRDNIGHIGQTLFAQQDDELRGFLTNRGSIESWIVVDSSAYLTRAIGWSDAKLAVRLADALNLGFAIDVAEIAGSNQQHETQENAARIRSHFANTGSGLYLTITESPWDRCREILSGNNAATKSESRTAIDSLVNTGAMPEVDHHVEEHHLRARSVLSLLVAARGTADPRQDWSSRAKANRTQKTTLSSLGVERTADLVHHGYVGAAAQAHLTFGWPLPPADAIRHERFTAIVSGDDEVDVIVDIRDQSGSASSASWPESTLRRS